MPAARQGCQANYQHLLESEKLQLYGRVVFDRGRLRFEIFLNCSRLIYCNKHFDFLLRLRNGFPFLRGSGVIPPKY